jgi:acetylxylan esterase
MDDAFCGGPDGQSLTTPTVPVPQQVGARVVAMIWMGNPRFVGGLPYNVGSARLGGVSSSSPEETRLEERPLVVNQLREK